MFYGIISPTINFPIFHIQPRGVVAEFNYYSTVTDFAKFRPSVFTVEHNFTSQQEKIDDLMNTNNYIRVFKNITAFDAWYVSAEKLKI